MKESEAGWEHWEVRGVLFQMEERLDKGKKSRGPRPRGGAEPAAPEGAVGGRS